MGADAPPLPELDALDEAEADLWATGLTVGPTAVELARPKLDALGVIPAARLADMPQDDPPPVKDDPLTADGGRAQGCSWQGWSPTARDRRAQGAPSF